MGAAADQPSRFVAVAFPLARLGLHVFPLAPGDKEPAISRRDGGQGFKDATTDEATIQAWGRRFPDANVGIALEASGLVGLDVDKKSGGLEQLEQLIGEHGQLPETPCTHTGGGGRHYYFKRPVLQDGEEYKKTVTPGIDFRLTGYFVAPGSRHASGADYVAEFGAELGEIALADVPAWLLTRQRLTKPTDHQRYTPRGDGAFFLELLFHMRGWILHPHPSQAGTLCVTCPWKHEHTTESNDTETVLYPPAHGQRYGFLKCLHSHCASRTVRQTLDLFTEAEKDTVRIHLGWKPRPVPPNSQPPPDDTAPPPPPPSWETQLRYNATGILTKDAGNVSLFLANHPDWHGALTYDAFWDRVMWTREVPPLTGLAAPEAGDALQEHHILYVQQWMALRQHQSFSKDAVADAIVAAAKMRTVNPLRDYLLSLAWDGTPRLARWLSTYLGVPPTPVSGAVGVWWAVSAVARGLRPGCQADHVLVLEGKQGEGKSAAVRILAGAWYLPELPDLRSKDAAQLLNGNWIIEVDELDAFKGAASTRVKSFVSRPLDVYRPPYARLALRRPRCCVFVGTTNEDDWADDATGARRYWPAVVAKAGPIRLKPLEQDRDQLWAEAVRAFHDGQAWWPNGTSLAGHLADEQEARYRVDEWEPKIAQYLALRADVTIGDVLLDVMKLETRDWGRAEQMRVATVLKRLGWGHDKSKNRKRGGARVWEPGS